MVRAGKLKSGASKKLNRWKFSSTSNAKTNRFRQEAMAKKGLVKLKPGNDGLTEEKLKVLDAMTNMKSRPDEEDIHIDDIDLNSEHSAATFKTFVSGVSDCTNITFNRVKKYWEQNAEKHKETVAILAAITELIRERDFDDNNEAAYFAVLSTTLNQVTTEESLAAVAYLFSLNLRHVPQGIICEKFGELTSTLLTLLAKGFTSTALLKSLVACLGTVLRRGTTSEAWGTVDAKTALSVLLAFTLHSKPKVRKSGQKSVAILLHSSGISQGAVNQVAIFCCTELQKCTVDAKTLHLMAFVRAVITVFPLSSQRDICQICLRLQTLGSRMVRIHAFKTLNAFFRGTVRKAQMATLAINMKEMVVEEDSKNVDNVKLEKLEGIPVELISKLIVALNDVRPSSGDKNVCHAWMEVINSCCFTISSSDQPRVILIHLPMIIQSIFVLMEEFDLAPDGSSILQKCLMVSLTHITSTDLDEGNVGHLIITEILKGISYKYSAVIDSLMDVLGSFYTSLPIDLDFTETAIAFMLSPLDGLNQLRSNPLFNHKISLDSCVGSILSVVGPRNFLSKLPVQISGDPDIDGDIPTRCGWILPIMELKMKNRVELSIFFQTFAKMADQFIKEASSLDKYQSPVYQTLYREVWSLFPNFCANPVDEPANFLKPGSAKGLNLILESQADHHKEVKPMILSGLRKLILFSLEDGRKEYRKVFDKYTSNYLHTLFNMYRSRELPALSLSTAKEFVKISSVDTIIKFYKEAEGNAKTEEDFKLQAIYWDIVVILTPWLPEENIRKLFKESIEMTSNSGATIQKKGWRIMEYISSSDNESCKKVLEESVNIIVDQMMMTLSTCAAPARKPRLQLLEVIMNRIDNKDFLRKITTELVICSKDNNAISRALSFRLLENICQRYLDLGSDDEKPVLEFIQVLLQGLTGNPLVVSCTLNVLNVIMYKFKSYIPSTVHGMILENVLLLMESAAREILKSTVSFLITLTKTLDTAGIAPHVERIVTAIVNWKAETRNPFRIKVRRLLERLVKKFGFDIVQKFVPDGTPIAKMLANAKKIQTRNMRNRLENKANGAEQESDDDLKGAPETLDDLINETDSEDESENTERSDKSRKKSSYKTRLHEDGEDFVDFLSTSAAQSLTTQKQKKVRKVRKVDDDEIGTAPDGRIIVREKEKVDVDMLSSDEEDVDDELSVSDQKSIAQPVRQKSTTSKKTKHVSKQHDGTGFKAKKAGGDVKRAGKHDPYSYLPLRKDMLNKRRKHKGANVPGLKNIIRGAQKGVRKGKKRAKKSN